MSLQIAQIIAERDARVLAQACADMPFSESGPRPAVAHHSEALRRILTLVERRLSARHAFRDCAIPAAIGGLQLVKITEETANPTLTTPALIGNLRGDIGFVVPLSDPGSYEGGEVEGTNAAALRPGDALLCDADRPFALAPVTSGALMLVCGAVQSHVPQPEKRAILQALAAEIEALRTQEEVSLNQLEAIHSNLLRMWAAPA